MWKILLLALLFNLTIWCVHSQVTEDICEEDNNELHFVNDFACCACYFTCFAGTPFPQRCPTGFHFDSISRDCRPIAEAVCDRCPEGEGVFSFPVEGSCIDYTLCINGQSLERSCPNGTRFNPPTERCKPREEVQCQADVICAADIPGIEIMAHPNYCDQFVICMDGEVLEIRQCANGLLFDPSVGQCVRADICSYDISISKRRNSLFDRLIPKAPVHTN